MASSIKGENGTEALSKGPGASGKVPRALVVWRPASLEGGTKIWLSLSIGFSHLLSFDLPVG
jgi:hypothetical protein